MEISINDRHDIESIEAKLYSKIDHRPDFGDLRIRFKGSGDLMIISFDNPDQTLPWFDVLETIQQFLCGGEPINLEAECPSTPLID